VPVLYSLYSRPLRYDAGLDYAAMAATLGISTANVEKRLYRARQAVLAALG
jgi:DNA-directed RNA polymerase specialized sigma24 family protein